MGKAQPVGDVAGIADVAAGAAGPRPVGSRAVVVKLKRDADHVVARPLQKPGHDGGIDPARHRHHDAGFVAGLAEVKVEFEHVFPGRERKRNDVLRFP